MTTYLFTLPKVDRSYVGDKISIDGKTYYKEGYQIVTNTSKKVITTLTARTLFRQNPTFAKRVDKYNGNVYEVVDPVFTYEFDLFTCSITMFIVHNYVQRTVASRHLSQMLLIQLSNSFILQMRFHSRYKLLWLETTVDITIFHERPHTIADAVDAYVAAMTLQHVLLFDLNITSTVYPTELSHVNEPYYLQQMIRPYKDVKVMITID